MTTVVTATVSRGQAQQSRHFPEADERDPVLLQEAAHARVAQRSELQFALPRIRGDQGGVRAPGVAGELGDAVVELRVEESNETGHAHSLRMAFPAPLPVEARAVPDPRAVPEGDPEPLGELLEQG